MEKKINKHSFRPIAIMFLLAIFLVMSTYAWFTSNKLVKVNSLEIHVQASEGLQISLDATNWKALIETSEIMGDEVNNQYGANKNHIPDNMTPVSTATTTDPSTGFMNMYFGSVSLDAASSEYVITANKDTEEKGGNEGYIAFDLFFKINYDVYLYLEKTSDVVDIGEGTRAGKGIENAARVGLVDQGNVSADSPLTGNALVSTAQGLRYTDYQDGRNVTIWEPNYLSHTEEAKTEVFNMYGISPSSSIWDSRIKYDGIYNEITEPPILLTQANEAQSPNYFKAIPDTRIVATPADRTDDADTGITLKAGITKMRVYMWLEGQDYDCGDSASGSDARFDLTFTVVRVNP